MLVLLGAGRPYRGTPPSALQATPDQRTVLDWIRDAFSEVAVEWHFVVGYHLVDVVRRFPDIEYSINVDWETTGSVESLFAAPLAEDRATYVAYTDVVFDAETVRRIEGCRADAVIAVDRTWRFRYQRRRPDEMRIAEKARLDGERVQVVARTLEPDDADAEFTGLLKLFPNAMREVLRFRSEQREKWSSAGIPDLITALIDAGCNCVAVDVEGRWAELNAPQDLARFVLGTKAETLERLRPMVRHSKIGEQVSFSVGEWRKERDRLVERIRARFAGDEVVVRSSALAEDSWSTANAGAFLSLMHVPVDSRDAITDAINRVAESYMSSSSADQILVQRMLTDVELSGVAFTRTLTSGAPYRVINYDDSTGTTASVTGGTGRELKTLVMSRGTDRLPATADARLSRLLRALDELESLVGHDSLDVEFAVSRESELHVLQVRPIAVDHSDWSTADASVEAAILSAEREFDARQAKSPFLGGDRAIFGVMPDWNPAEIIGAKPRRLALSLYRYLITEEVWAISRAETGYRDVRPCPLLVCFAGHPYIDVRASFSSFVPATISEPLANRLVGGYLARLAAAPHLHDKVEFEIAFTCLTLDFDEQARRLLEDGISTSEVEELRSALLELTRNAFKRPRFDLERVDVAESRFLKLRSAALPPLTQACLLLEDARRSTLPFSNLARLGFIATALLRSGVRVDALTNDGHARFMESLNTVARQFSDDGAKVSAGELSWEEYVDRYGHLRPGTYEITSPCYATDPERYLRPTVSVADESPVRSDFGFDQKATQALTERMRSAGLLDRNQGLEEFEAFCRASIEGRESSKFVFTRNLSAALELIASFGQDIGLSREELSHVDLEDLRNVQLGTAPADATAWLRDRALEGEREHRVAQAIELPPLLTNELDFRAFMYPEVQPNFVGRGCVSAEVSDLTERSAEPSELGGRIILIPQADPGFDWLFGQRIAGLVTMYGGANSHMAIRSAELGLPAAIGIGESLYLQLRHAKVIELDAGARRIQVLQ